ncbi:MAG: hypothetical protein NT133_25575 [Alphaproteobacteria bacterium]|nr:hypothetical protein [Alphaproteobacteria bacterium]
MQITEIRWLSDATLTPFSMIAVRDGAITTFFMIIWLRDDLARRPCRHDRTHSCCEPACRAVVLCSTLFRKGTDCGGGEGMTPGPMP